MTKEQAALPAPWVSHGDTEIAHPQGWRVVTYNSFGGWRVCPPADAKRARYTSGNFLRGAGGRPRVFKTVTPAIAAAEADMRSDSRGFIAPPVRRSSGVSVAARNAA